MSDPRMDQFLKDAHIQFLHDEGVLIDDSFYLFGRADEEPPGRGISKRLSPKELTEDMDQTADLSSTMSRISCRSLPMQA